MRGGLVSREVADRFVEALRKLEEDRDVEGLVQIHTEDCDVGNIAVPKTFSGHEGLREFWTGYRDTFGEMRSEFRNVFASACQLVSTALASPGALSARVWTGES